MFNPHCQKLLRPFITNAQYLFLRIVDTYSYECEYIAFV